MKIAIAAETDTAEPRVAGTPDTVKRMIALGDCSAAALQCLAKIFDVGDGALATDHRRGQPTAAS